MTSKPHEITNVSPIEAQYQARHPDNEHYGVKEFPSSDFLPHDFSPYLIKPRVNKKPRQKNLVAYGATAQQSVFKGFQLETKSDGRSFAQPDSANALRRLAEREFEKRFSRCCTVAQKPTLVA
jgi:hypothetical protein